MSTLFEWLAKMWDTFYTFNPTVQLVIALVLLCSVGGAILGIVKEVVSLAGRVVSIVLVVAIFLLFDYNGAFQPLFNGQSLITTIINMFSFTPNK